MIISNFKNLLKNISYPNQNQRNKELWDIKGILHNQSFKFDLRPLKNNSKAGNFNTKADKIVLDIKDQFIIVDTEELHQYLKDNKIKVVNLEQLILDLDWNIILPK